MFKGIIIILLFTFLKLSFSIFHYSIDTRQFSKIFDRKFKGDPYAYALQKAIEDSSQPSGYCFSDNVDFPVTHNKICGSEVKNNVGWIIDLKWTDSSFSSWDFQIGSDFDLGIAVFVNDYICVSRNENLNWKNDWKSDSVVKFNYNFEPGSHVITIYGGETYAKTLNIRYKKDGDQKWKDFTIKNLNSDVPYPKAITIAESKEFQDRDGEIGQRFGNRIQKQFLRTDPLNKKYCDIFNPQWPISNQKNCPKGSQFNIFYLYNIEFELKQNNHLQFQFGVDFSNGYAIFIDDKYYSSSSKAVWWGEEFSDEDGIIDINMKFNKGTHLIQIYGRGECCDGQQSVRYRVGKKGEFQPLTKKMWWNSLQSKLRVKIKTRKLEESFLKESNQGFLFPYDYRDVFYQSKQPEGYCKAFNPSWPITNSEICAMGAIQDILWKFDIIFYESQKSDYTFEFGVNFARGAIIYFNGEEIMMKDGKMKWKNSWEYNDDDIIAVKLQLKPHSINTLVIYGAEYCCDEGSDIRFSKNGDRWPGSK